MKKRIKELTEILNKANYDYYELSKPTISDFEYDKYYLELVQLEKEYPQYKLEDSPTYRVGGTISSKFQKEKHSNLMLSIENIFDLDGIYDFDKKIKEQNIIPEYVCELKIDGLSIALIYEKGLLKKAITRGNGEYGENVTINVKTIKDIPLKLSEELDIEVRGEIYLNKKTFEKINKERIQENLEIFKNPRNTASGTLRQLDSTIVAQRNLKNFIYQGLNTNIDNHYETLLYLKKLGFKVNEYCKKANNIEEVIEYIKKITKIKKNLDYEIDGVVIKINNYEQQKLLGITSKFPKFIAAYKFTPEESITKIIDIIYTVGRTGKITPNAVLEPVFIQGSTISRATLHNEKNIIDKNIQINDDVVVRKAGEIIPEVFYVKNKNKDSKKFKMITNCPICKSELKKENVDLYCVNENCPKQEIEKIIHFASKDAMNIETLGEKIVEDFYNYNYLKDISDIYNLKKYKEELMQLENFGEKSITKLLDNIEKSKKNSLEKLLFGLGIKEVGIKTSKTLAKNYNTIDNIMNLQIEDLINIYDIGEVISENIIEYFKSNKEIINKLKNHNINFEYINEKIYNKNITNKNFVITGTLNNTRSEIKDLIEKNGGNVIESVSNKIDYLVLGLNPGSKYEKAKKLNIEILNEEKLINLTKNR